MNFFKEAIEGISEIFFTPTSLSEHQEKVKFQPKEHTESNPFGVKFIGILVVIATMVISARIY